MLVMLCMSLSAAAENVNGVNIDGVYYNLQNSWYYDYYDANGNYRYNSFSNVAFVTSNPDTEVITGR